MQRHFDQDLRELKAEILAMGGFVERAIEEAIQALLSREPNRFELVFDFERNINQAHIRVDEMCLMLLARQSPLAADLRLIIAVIKINTDLERMGDQAINISHNAKRYLEGNPIKPLNDIPKMAREVQGMVRSALDSFVLGDPQKARDVLARDDSVDDGKNRVFTDLKAEIQRDPSTVEQALNLMLIARNLERLGDHATNIAEDVIFAVTGQDIRHGARKATT
jgi:phosphate transport system protein